MTPINFVRMQFAKSQPHPLEASVRNKKTALTELIAHAFLHNFQNVSLVLLYEVLVKGQETVKVFDFGVKTHEF